MNSTVRFKTSSSEFLNARLPGSVLVMNQILRSEPYGLVKAFRLFMNSYIRLDATRLSRLLKSWINDTLTLLISANAIITRTSFGHRFRRDQSPRDFEFRAAE